MLAGADYKLTVVASSEPTAGNYHGHVHEEDPHKELVRQDMVFPQEGLGGSFSQVIWKLGGKGEISKSIARRKRKTRLFSIRSFRGICKFAELAEDLTTVQKLHR